MLVYLLHGLYGHFRQHEAWRSTHAEVVECHTLCSVKRHTKESGLRVCRRERIGQLVHVALKLQYLHLVAGFEGELLALGLLAHGACGAYG